VFAQHDNQVAGHPIRMFAEDTACNAEGGQTAATKLAANQNIVLVFGPACSSAATPGAPILWKAGIPSIGTSPSAPTLTAPDRNEGYHGFSMPKTGLRGNCLGTTALCGDPLCVAPTHHAIALPKRVPEAIGATRDELAAWRVLLDKKRPGELDFCPSAWPLGLRCDPEAVAKLAGAFDSQPIMVVAAWSHLAIREHRRRLDTEGVREILRAAEPTPAPESPEEAAARVEALRAAAKG
jgi:hypothetical protein